MRKLALVLPLFAASAAAADFRAVDIGQSCASVREWEMAQGSTTVPWGPIAGAEMLAFKVHEFELDVVALYFCMKGTLRTGNYFFPIESLEKAVESYRLIYEQFLSKYGNPSLDTSAWNSDKRWIASDTRKYSTSWWMPHVYASLAIVHDGKGEKLGYRAFLVISPPLADKPTH